MATDFFGKFTEVVGAPPEVAPAEAPAERAPAPAPRAVSPWIWVLGVLVVVAVLLAIFGL